MLGSCCSWCCLEAEIASAQGFGGPDWEGDSQNTGTLSDAPVWCQKRTPFELDWGELRRHGKHRSTLAAQSPRFSDRWMQALHLSGDWTFSKNWELGYSLRLQEVQLPEPLNPLPDSTGAASPSDSPSAVSCPLPALTLEKVLKAPPERRGGVTPEPQLMSLFSRWHYLCCACSTGRKASYAKAPVPDLKHNIAESVTFV